MVIQMSHVKKKNLNTKKIQEYFGAENSGGFQLMGKFLIRILYLLDQKNECSI
jgi:RecA-family ATPase